LASGGARNKNQTESATDFAVLQQNVNALFTSTGAQPTSQDIVTIYNLYIKSKQDELSFRDAPNARAHRMQILEFRLKIWAFSLIGIATIVFIASTVWSTKDPKEQNSRVDRLIQIFSGTIGGLGLGGALGHRYSKAPSNHSEPQ